VISGSVEVELDDDGGQLRHQRLGTGEAIRILPGRRHRITALDDADLVEVSSPEIEDLVRLEDRYGRVPASRVTP
jgi:quercetin dioxygenase-like cupin family protein